MKKSRYTEEQIIGILKQHEAGVKTRLHPGLMLLQYPDDLLFRVPALLHLLPSSQIIYERTPDSTGRVFRGHVMAMVLLLCSHPVAERRDLLFVRPLHLEVMG